MHINSNLLESTCRNAIETILYCLPHATMGTIYTIGPVPQLRAVKVASGTKMDPGDEVLWGVAPGSRYDPPGLQWEEYRDEPGRPLEAMGWCVQHQKSWTTDNPADDVRSARKQRFDSEDYHHMEPVLVRKSDLYGLMEFGLEYPTDWEGAPIWQASEFVVVAVIKIHFLPQTIHRRDRSTRIIKKLSSTLGTELLSLYLRETYLAARDRLTNQRLQTSNAIAHELRNTMAKLGFVFSAINAVVGVLREQWETDFERVHPQVLTKAKIGRELSDILARECLAIESSPGLVQICRGLEEEHRSLFASHLLPAQDETRIASSLIPKWNRLLSSSKAWDPARDNVERLLSALPAAIRIVLDEQLAGEMTDYPEDLRTILPSLAYTHYTSANYALIERLLKGISTSPPGTVLHREQINRALISLIAMVETISSLEEQSNRLIYELRAGDSSTQLLE